jgi:hypothetical protein
MADYADTAVGREAAETRAYDLVRNGTWVNAHVGVDKDGHTVIRFQRFMANTATPGWNGEWVETRSDSIS